jgi:hypothetical protein
MKMEPSWMESVSLQKELQRVSLPFLHHVSIYQKCNLQFAICNPKEVPYHNPNMLATLSGNLQIANLWEIIFSDLKST